MRFGIIHNSLNSCGGGERVSLGFIKVLRKLGHEVVLATVEPTDWGKVKRLLGSVEMPDEEISLVSYKVRAFGIYMRQLTSILAPKLLKKCDILINTHGDILPVKAHITYMHFPTFLLTTMDPSLTLENRKYAESLFWRIYYEPYRAISKRLAEKNADKTLILTNSEYSRSVIEKFLKVKPIIVYPPVPAGKFQAKKLDNREREVVSVGRFTPEKRYEFALSLADALRNTKFTIIGASSGKISKSYIKKLRRIIKKRNLTNVTLIQNAPQRELIKTLQRASVYLHSMHGEHFGISIVEAMAAGLFPVVHASGGAWRDILNNGEYGYGYRSLPEAIIGIQRGINTDPEERKRIIDRAMQYDEKNFERKIRTIVELFEKN